jgi:tRNA-dihydrouridine synthase A
MSIPSRCSWAAATPRSWPAAARIGAAAGYAEINLNVGCPSDRVKNGSFGACLMLKPALVAECVRACATRRACR